MGVSTQDVGCWGTGEMEATTGHLVKLALRRKDSADGILGRVVAHAEPFKETDVSFSNTAAGLNELRQSLRQVRPCQRGRGGGPDEHSGAQGRRTASQAGAAEP